MCNMGEFTRSDNWFESLRSIQTSCRSGTRAFGPTKSLPPEGRDLGRGNVDIKDSALAKVRKSFQ